MDNTLILHNHLRELRKRRKWTQSDLGKKVGVSINTISSIENEEFCPSAKLAALICAVLDVKFEDVFYLDE